MKKIKIFTVAILVIIIAFFAYKSLRSPSPSSKDDLIYLDSPISGETIDSPLNINGKARGNWYFEGSFPILLTDWDGKIIAEGSAKALGEWMTEDFVPFKAVLEFDDPYEEINPEFMKNATLVLQKDNPSGKPEYDNALEIPVKFR